MKRIGRSVTVIGSYVFQDCSKLESVTIPDCVGAIYDYAFRGCNALKKIDFRNNAPSFDGNAPGLDSQAFSLVTATAYYLAGNFTWTEDVITTSGVSCTWEGEEG